MNSNKKEAYLNWGRCAAFSLICGLALLAVCNVVEVVLIAKDLVGSGIEREVLSEMIAIMPIMLEALEFLHGVSIGGRFDIRFVIAAMLSMLWYCLCTLFNSTLSGLFCDAIVLRAQTVLSVSLTYAAVIFTALICVVLHRKKFTRYAVFSIAIVWALFLCAGCVIK
jgi:hypothetical protein